MRPRAEVAGAAGVLLLLGVGAAALGARRARMGDSDPRRSTYLAGPSGALAFAQALERLGVGVDRLRLPLGAAEIPEGRTHDALLHDALLVVLGPAQRLDVRDARRLAESSADLLLAGPRAGSAMRCLGYRVVRQRPESARLPSAGPAGTLSVRAVLAERGSRTVTDSLEGEEGAAITCAGPAALRVDTLLGTASGGVVAVRLGLADGREAVLVADDAIFSNRALRETPAGPFALGLVVPRYRRVVVDEYHQGFAASGSLAGAVLGWSLRSPWGWAGWQLVVTGLVALIAAGIRFGPVRPGIERRRRSPLEHVRALASALAAARGHQVAVELLVHGLRRRLSRAGRLPKGDAEAWLEGLAAGLRTERGRAALATLQATSRGPTDAPGVTRAAHAVEDVWEDLRPA